MGCRFVGYRIKTSKTKKRAVSREVINLIDGLELKENSRMWHARNYFLFSFYSMCMNFADIAHLKPDKIIDGRLEYIRQKTRKQYSIKITERINEILSYYLNDQNESKYIFPIIVKAKALYIFISRENSCMLRFLLNIINKVINDRVSAIL